MWLVSRNRSTSMLPTMAALLPDDIYNYTWENYDSFYNCGTNASGNLTSGFGPEYHKTLRVYTLTVMFVTSLLGNTMMMKHLEPFKRGRVQKWKVLFINLAAADLTVTFGSMLSQLIWELVDQEWYIGNIPCKLFKFSQTYSLSSSTYMLVAIALDRYNAIVKPFFKSKSKCYAMMAWITGVIPSFPCLFFFHKIWTCEGIPKCISKFYPSTNPEDEFYMEFRKPYMICVLTAVYIVPFFLLLVFHCKIIREICVRSSVFSTSQQTSSYLPKAKTKTLKMTCAILMTFILFNLPYILLEVLVAFGCKDIGQSFSSIAGVFSAGNSAVNPYIYLLFQPKIRFGRFVRSLVTAIRSKQWSSTSHRKDTSSFSASSKMSSKFEMNAVTTGSPSKAAKAASVINGSRKLEGTPV